VPIIVVPLLLSWFRIEGQDAGLYDTAFGTALHSLTAIALFFALLWWTAENISWHDLMGRKAQGRLAAIIESSDDVIVSKSLEGIIESWNGAAERTFGYSASEAIGKHISLIIPPDRLNEETDIISRLRRGERIDHFETVRVRKGGAPINVSLTVSPVRDADGRIIGASKIARDISDRLRIEKERELLLASERSAREDAERASQLKDEFLATLSHELRTPLNAILGWSQLLNLDPEKNDLQEGLDAIERNARVQTQLIEDLLDMSRIISGKVRLDVQPTNMAQVIEEAIASITPAADAKGITVRKVLDPNAGPISGDPTRLQQVVWNLLANSIKFTPKGGKVDIVLARVNSHIEVTVRDTGIGISAEYLPVIFERFRQVDSSTTRTHGGLGLGLSIVKNLVELHGGTIHAESGGENQGASFYIALPLSPLRPDEDRVHPSTPRGHRVGGIDLAGSKVLVVDDEPDARLLVERLLANCGASVTAAGSAADGLAQLREFRPHVLVSDIGMPITDGYQFIRDVRKLGENEGGRTPAIALTAFARSEDRTQAMLAGYQMHIAKPIEPQELAVAVQMLSRQTDSLGS
jgi:PAS domain S-box-containing protein